MSESRDYTLVRGERTQNFVSDERLQEIIDDARMSSDQKIKAIANILETMRCRSYAGTYFSVTFRVTRSIKLVALGFWGPYEDSSAIYTANIEISQSNSINSRDGKGRTVLQRVEQRVEAKRGEVFYIHLDEPLVCLDRTWIQIHFMLTGPPTYSCKKVLHEYKTKQSLIFDFYSSSKQLPEIKYQLL